MNLTIIFNNIKPVLPYVTAGLIFVFQQFAGQAVNKCGSYMSKSFKKSITTLQFKKETPKKPYDIEIERWL